MLSEIGADTIEALFDEIPESLRCGALERIPAAMNEAGVTRLAGSRARSDGVCLNFIGAGAYEHHIPAAVWQIAGRGEFYTSYTPYQAEASQGTLQLLYEFQSMMASLTGMDASNASVYDGASATAEAILMAVRARRGPRRVLIAGTLHPLYRRAVRSIVALQGIELVELPYCTVEGNTVAAAIDAHAEDVAAVVIPQPNFFGVIEDAGALTDAAHRIGALAIAVCNPLALALLQPPGEWGSGAGADICCGDAQPFGIPLSGGGPYLGYLTCKQPLVRQLPGRIVGRTLDLDGRTGYTLTLQAREQHIRRARATSNICTNQGLMATAATIHLALTGAEGLARIAAACHARTRELCSRMAALAGVEPVFAGAFFHERVMRLPRPACGVLEHMARSGILGGYDLAQDYPELGPALLVCATETKTAEDLDRYAGALARALT
ncbi:MAG: aminomethyl-transferring glycine dehydrogenase subunit GcvPA [Rhodocyclaceae bacterium]